VHGLLGLGRQIGQRAVDVGADAQGRELVRLTAPAARDVLG